MMEYDILLESVACLIHKIHTSLGIVRVYFAAALIYRQEYRLYTGSGLCHQASRSRRSDC